MSVLKSPPWNPRANAICKRLICSTRRECLKWLVPMSEAHLRAVLKEWKGHHNASRPHMTLESGVPGPPPKTS
jgi:putative transposase